ncbi:MAG: hypothetical protein ACI4K7_12960 [Oscillospiraceae bacterium]
MSLFTPWGYIPEKWQLDTYREMYLKHYDDEMIKVFDAACALTG